MAESDAEDDPVLTAEGVDFLKDFDRHVGRMDTLFGSLIQGAKMTSWANCAKDGFDTSVSANSLVLSAHRLQHMLRELKTSAVLLDYEATGSAQKDITAQAAESDAVLDANIRSMTMAIRKGKAQKQQGGGGGGGDA